MSVSILILCFVNLNSYDWASNFFGYFKFDHKVEIFNNNGDKMLRLNIIEKDSVKYISGAFQIRNNERSNIILPQDSSLRIYITGNSQHIDTIYLMTKDADSSMDINIGHDEFKVVNFYSAPISSSTSSYLDHPKCDSLIDFDLKLFYLPKGADMMKNRHYVAKLLYLSKNKY
jgi:hypothetical protein